MPANDVADSYNKRSAEYIELFGSIEAMDARDRDLVSSWAQTTGGVLLDLGCGPGHITKFLSSLGCEILGVDPSSAFLKHAQRHYPGVRFLHGDSTDLRPLLNVAGVPTLTGILCWYSLIHLEPADLGKTLDRIREALQPTGTLLLAFFEGEHGEKFDHKVHCALTWSLAVVVKELEVRGFSVSSSGTRKLPTGRTHAHIQAKLITGT